MTTELQSTITELQSTISEMLAEIKRGLEHARQLEHKLAAMTGERDKLHSIMLATETARLILAVENGRLSTRVAELERICERLTDERDNAYRDILSIRCIEHLNVPQQNASEITGAECGACIAADRDRLAEQNRVLQDSVAHLQNAVKLLHPAMISECGEGVREGVAISLAAAQTALEQTKP